MVFEKLHEDKILEAVRKAAASVDYGEVRVKIDKTASKLEIVIETQEKLRLEKNA
jgi:hypothetical protein